jgi:hypothetical protein
MPRNHPEPNCTSVLHPLPETSTDGNFKRIIARIAPPGDWEAIGRAR